MSVVDGDVCLRERSDASSSSYQACEMPGSAVGPDVSALASITPVTGACSSTTGTPTWGVPVRRRSEAGAGIAGGPNGEPAGAGVTRGAGRAGGGAAPSTGAGVGL